MKNDNKYKVWENISFGVMSRLITKYKLHCDFAGTLYFNDKYVGFKSYVEKEGNFSLHINTEFFKTV